MAALTDNAAELVEGILMTNGEDAESPSSPNLLASTTGMAAVTMPVVDGTSVSMGAKPPALVTEFELTFRHEELGWCCHLVPPGGPVAQIFEFERLREANPDAAASLFAIGERAVRTAAVGDLASLQACFQESLATPHWQQPLPLWFLVRILSIAAPQGHLPMVRWLLAGGCSAVSLPPLKHLVHDIVQRAMPSGGGSSGMSSGTNSGAKDNISAVVRALVTDGGFDVSFPRSGDGWTPLHACCSRNLVTLARELLELGAEVNAVGLDDKLPLNVADRVAQMLRPRVLQPRRRRKPRAANPVVRDPLDPKDKETAGEKSNTVEVSDSMAELNISATKPAPTTASDDQGDDSDSDNSNDYSSDDDEEEATATPATAPAESEPPQPTPMQLLLLSHGARRTWRREPVPAPAKTMVRTSGFAGGSGGGFSFSTED